jgi:hypothetical protein
VSAVRGRPRIARRRTRAPAGPIHPSPGLLATHPRLAFYAGLGLMVVLEFIEWPVAIAIGLGHEIAHRARRPAVRELVEGIEEGV